MNRILLILIVILGITISGGRVCAQVADINDSLALRTIYDSLGGDNWSGASNWQAKGPVSSPWEGVVLNAKGQVISLTLDSKNLAGIIPGAIGNLKMLGYLEINKNPLVISPIPSQIAGLDNLTILSLQNDGFTEKLPTFLANFKSLQRVTLASNSFTGPIPDLSNLQTLISLSLSFNPLNTDIPTTLKNLPLLAHINFEYCGLTGEIPPEIGNLTRMVELELYHNNLTGQIPKQLNNLISVRKFNLEANQLSGPIPDLSGLDSSTILNIDSNKFTFTGMQDLVNFNTGRTVPAALKYSPQFPDMPVNINAAGTKLSVNAGVTAAGNLDDIEYQWYNGSTPFTTIIGDSTLGITSQTCGKYSVAVTYPVFLPDLTLYSSDSFVVKGSATLSIAADTDNVCPGVPINFKATPTGGGTPTYQWLVNGTAAGTSADTFAPTNLKDGDKVTCILTGTDACSNPLSATSNAVIVAIKASTQTTFNKHPITTSVCQGSTGQTLPAESDQPATGVWTPSSTVDTKRPGTTTYVFTPTAGTCATTFSIDIFVSNGLVKPTFKFTTLSACVGGTAPKLGNSSENITGVWTPSTVDVTTPGTKSYTFTPDAGQCAADTTIDFTVNAPPTVQAGPSQTITGADSVELSATVTANPSTDPVTVLWTPSSGLSNSNVTAPRAYPSTTTLYRITVTSQEKCSASDNLLVTVDKSTANSLDVPNAFSPNGDGLHDTWQIKNLDLYYPEATVTIFNRLGQKMHEWDGDFSGWDGNYNGNPLPVGTYYYVIDLKKDKKKLSGSITILR